MNYPRRQISTLLLNENERLSLILDGKAGLVMEIPVTNDCIIVTNQRLISLSVNDGRYEEVFLPVRNVSAVEVTDSHKNSKPLIQSGLLLGAAALVIWLAIALNISGILPWIIAAVLVALSAINASTYFLPEDPAKITFHLSSTAKVTLKLHTPESMETAHALSNSFFALNASEDSDTTTAYPNHKPLQKKRTRSSPRPKEHTSDID